jgi:hypothetical protein
MSYLFVLILVLVFLLIIKLVWVSMPMADMMVNWKQFGHLPEGVNKPNDIPIECVDSGKKMSSMGCSVQSAMVLNEYELPDKLLFC